MAKVTNKARGPRLVPAEVDGRFEHILLESGETREIRINDPGTKAFKAMVDMGDLVIEGGGDDDETEHAATEAGRFGRLNPSKPAPAVAEEVQGPGDPRSGHAGGRPKANNSRNPRVGVRDDPSALPQGALPDDDDDQPGVQNQEAAAQGGEHHE